VGVPIDLAGDPALAGDGGGLVLQVEVADIEAEDLVGAGRSVIQQPPQRFLPHGQVGPVPQRFQLTSGNDPPVGVAAQAAPLDRRPAVGARKPTPAGSEQRGAVGGGNTSASARRPGGRIGAEHGLDGVGDELSGLRVDGDVTAEQHAADDLPGVPGRVLEAVGHVSSLS
jgi:hypothetical protein